MESLNAEVTTRRIRGGGALRTALVLTLFAACFLWMTLSSYTRTSATWDEPLNLSCGYAALRHGDYRIAPGHPPLLRMWNALPLLWLPEVRMDIGSPSYVAGQQLGVASEFLYRDNDADRLLYRARFMTVLLGVLLGMLLFVWARELLGFPTAIAVLVLYCLEPNFLAHSSLVSTDVGLILFYFGTAYFLWRSTRALTPSAVLGLCTCFALAQVSKFSAVVLAPVAIALLGLRALVPEPWPILAGRPREIASRTGKALLALGLTVLLLAATVTVIWGVHRFRFEMNAGPELPNVFESERNMQLGNPLVSGVMTWLEQRHWLPRAFTGGFRNALGIFQGDRYLGGVFHKETIWYFYPAVFLLKTPSTVILLALAAAFLIFARIRRWRWEWLVLGFPPAFYLGVAMLSPLNTGVRHILTVYPFLILMAGYAVRPLLAGKRRIVVLAGLGLLLLVETAVTYPDFLATYNLSARALEGESPWLLDSNLDWGQDLKGLKRWMDARGVREINLSYFGTASPEYYGIKAAYLPGGMAPSAQRLKLPGYVAVSLTNLYAFFGGEQLRQFYAPLRARKPDAIIGRSIHVWWVERPWWIK